MFNQQKAEQHLDALLKQHGIKVEKWMTTSCGRANWNDRTIKIPKPTNTDRFCVCMHEIKHIIDGDKGLRFVQEFACDKYAMEQARMLGFDGTDKWIRRMNWHALSRIAMAHNRGLAHSKIPGEIRSWFQMVDFSLWIGRKVWVGWDKNAECGYSISLRSAGYRQAACDVIPITNDIHWQA